MKMPIKENYFTLKVLVYIITTEAAQKLKWKDYNTDERRTIRLYDYHLYTEIRNLEKLSLPPICSFERFNLIPYKNPEGKIKIVYPDNKYIINNHGNIGEHSINNK